MFQQEDNHYVVGEHVLPKHEDFSVEPLPFWVFTLVASGAIAWLFRTAPLADLAYYVQAAARLVQGIDPYADPYTIPFGGGTFELRYIYPPLTVFALSFLTSLPLPLLGVAWNFLSAISVCLAARLLLESTGRARRVVQVWGVTALFLAFPPVLEGFYFGQVHAFVLLALFCFAVRAMRGSFGAAGAWIGCATLLKSTPVVLAMVFLRPEARKGAIYLLVTILAAGILFSLSARGYHLSVDFLRALPALLAGEFFWSIPENFSFAHFVAVLSGWERGSARLVAGAITFMLLVMTASVGAVRREGVVSPHLVSALSCLMVMASPIVWFHHLTWCLIPLGLEYVHSHRMSLRVLVVFCGTVMAVSMPVTVYAFSVVLPSHETYRELTGLLMVIVPLLSLFILSFLRLCRDAS